MKMCTEKEGDAVRLFESGRLSHKIPLPGGGQQYPFPEGANSFFGTDSDGKGSSKVGPFPAGKFVQKWALKLSLPGRKIREGAFCPIKTSWPLPGRRELAPSRKADFMGEPPGDLDGQRRQKEERVKDTN